MTENQPSGGKTSPLLIVFAWAIVGIPLAVGFHPDTAKCGETVPVRPGHATGGMTPSSW
jgi:hypothetical protein